MTFGMLREYIDILNTSITIMIDNELECFYDSKYRVCYWNHEEATNLCNRFNKYDNLLVSKIDIDFEHSDEPSLRVYLFDFEKVAKETEEFNQE